MQRAVAVTAAVLLAACGGSETVEQGASARLGDWEVTVEEVDLDADRPFIVDGWRAVTVTVTAAYVGDEEGEHHALGLLRLAVVLDDDTERYDTEAQAHACGDDVPDDLYQQPWIESGSQTGAICVSVPDDGEVTELRLESWDDDTDHFIVTP